MNTLRPLLKLLPLLLKSSELGFNTETFTRNISHGEVIWHYLKKNAVYFNYTDITSLLSIDPLRMAFRTIRDWYKTLSGNNPKQLNEEGRSLWYDEVYPELLSLFNNSTHGQRPYLRNLLFHEGWIDSRYPELRQIAHALLARSYVLDGRVMDLPSSRYGVVLLDAGIRQEGLARYYLAAYRIVQQLTGSYTCPCLSTWLNQSD